MKVLMLVALLFLLSCNNNKDTKVMMNMPGAYKIISTSVKSDKIDTTFTSSQQLKIYTGDFMMYANINSPDSISGFGIGSYTIDKDSLIENIIYYASDSNMNDQPASYNLAITSTAKGYKQIILGMKNNESETFQLTEEYETVSTDVKSPLDGAWKQVNRFDLNGKDTTWNKITQYKTYYAGHFMFGHTYLDSTGKIHTGMGYGTFGMKGDNKSNETIMASTYYQIRGKTVNIDISMNGKDEYTQTITNDEGIKYVETYQRLKK